jgi:hypothetical protein
MTLDVQTAGILADRPTPSGRRRLAEVGCMVGQCGAVSTAVAAMSACGCPDDCGVSGVCGLQSCGRVSGRHCPPRTLWQPCAGRACGHPAAGVPAAVDAWESSQYRTDRAVDSLYATAEEVLHVYGNQRVSATTDGHDLDLDHFLSGNHTIYLYAPAHQQRLLRPLFETITQQVMAAAQERAALAPDGMLSPRLGLFLDEAGNCAALSDLDVLATTARGARHPARHRLA